MKNKKITAFLIAISSLGFTFVANASQVGGGNSHYNVEQTKSYKNFVKETDNHNVTVSDQKIFKEYNNNH